MKRQRVERKSKLRLSKGKELKKTEYDVFLLGVLDTLTVLCLSPGWWLHISSNLHVQKLRESYAQGSKYHYLVKHFWWVYSNW